MLSCAPNLGYSLAEKEKWPVETLAEFYKEMQIVVLSWAMFSFLLCY